MTTLRSFLINVLSFSHRFFAASMFHKKIIDPRGIKYVGHLTRFSSIMLDLMICIFLLYLVAISVNYAFSFNLPLEILERYRMGLEIDEDSRSYINKYIILILTSQVVEFLGIAIGIIYLWHNYGTTPAKLITGIVILDEKTLELPTLKQSIKRFFALIISILPIFLGLIWVVFDKKGQAWHDKIAGTVVVTRSSMKNRKFI